MASQPNPMRHMNASDKFWSITKYTDLRKQDSAVFGACMRVCVSLVRRQISIWNNSSLVDHLSLHDPKPTVRSRGNAVVFRSPTRHFRMRFSSVGCRLSFCASITDFVNVEAADMPDSQTQKTANTTWAVIGEHEKRDHSPSLSLSQPLPSCYGGESGKAVRWTPPVPSPYNAPQIVPDVDSSFSDSSFCSTLNDSFSLFGDPSQVVPSSVTVSTQTDDLPVESLLSNGDLLRNLLSNLLSQPLFFSLVQAVDRAIEGDDALSQALSQE